MYEVFTECVWSCVCKHECKLLCGCVCVSNWSRWKHSSAAQVLGLTGPSEGWKRKIKDEERKGERGRPITVQTDHCAEWNIVLLITVRRLWSFFVSVHSCLRACSRPNILYACLRQCNSVPAFCCFFRTSRQSQLHVRTSLPSDILYPKVPILGANMRKCCEDGLYLTHAAT